MSKIVEEWRPVVGYEGLYEVSDWGNVRSLNYNKTGQVRELSKVNGKNNYLVVCLHKEGKQKEGKIHRLVAEAFIPNPDNKPCIDHINGNNQDNVVFNLRWATAAENTNNPITKARMKGIQNGRQKNRPDMSKKVYQYDSDWNFIAEYPSASEAGRILGCHFDTISKACRGVRNCALGYNWTYNKLN